MKKRILAIILSVSACFTIGAVAVNAAPAVPGTSDYEQGKPVNVATAPGNKVEVTNTNTATNVAIPKAALPAGVTTVELQTKQLPAGDATLAKVETLLKKDNAYKNATVIDFVLKDQDGNAITKFNGKISVTVKCPAGINTVLYYDNVKNTITDLGGTVKNGYITFETDHFSYYAMAEKTKTTNPATADTTSMTLVLVAGAAVIIAGGYLVSKKIAKSK